MKDSRDNELPLKDGQLINTRNGQEKVIGEITLAPDDSVCWTLQGNWYRRRDGEEMTGADGEPMTVQEFYKKRRDTLYKPYQPKTGARCGCRPGIYRDNCPNCEGTGWVIDFKAIRNR